MIVPVSGKVIGEAEKANAHAAIEEGWLTEGHWCGEFERKLRAYTGKREVMLCNSGSSANLLALASLELPQGSEVITTALNFPTTLNPIIQLGLVPVFIDCTLPEMVADANQVEAAVGPKTRAIMLAHTLGMPYDLPAILSICAKYDLRLIEDCCDALGTEDIMRGDLATLSFYPAHQITTGEGGAVLTDSPRLAKVIASFRDWGKDCWCGTGEDNTCGRRWAGTYDHKYIYSRLGYNLKMTDIQGAIGCAQVERLPDFVAARMDNHAYLYAGLQGLPFSMFHRSEGVSYFGFTLICAPGIDRNDLAQYLDIHGVHNRPVFAGNALRQPAYRGIHCRVINDLPNTDVVHERALWIGCWPGLNLEQLNYSIKTIKGYLCAC